MNESTKVNDENSIRASQLFRDERICGQFALRGLRVAEVQRVYFHALGDSEIMYDHIWVIDLMNCLRRIKFSSRTYFWTICHSLDTYCSSDHVSITYFQGILSTHTKCVFQTFPKSELN